MLGGMLCCGVLFAAAQQRSKYLFVYFTGNAPEQEQISYAVSDDGFDYVPLNDGRPVVSGDTVARTGGLRDPHLLRGSDGWFRMVATDMRSSLGWNSNRGIVLLRSRDLLQWEHHTVAFPEKFAGTPFAKVVRVWAPQTFYDTRAGKYLIYFSVLTDDGTVPYDRVYACYANADFSDVEECPRLLFDYGQAAIDPDIVQDAEGVCHLFFKTEADSVRKGIRQYTFTDLYRPDTWTLHEGYCETTAHNVEGAGVFPLADGDWCLMYDCYMNGYYQFTRSSDLRHFTFVKNTPTQGAFTPRHGSVLPISAKEYRRLRKAFPPKSAQ